MSKPLFEPQHIAKATAIVAKTAAALGREPTVEEMTTAGLERVAVGHALLAYAAEVAREEKTLRDAPATPKPAKKTRAHGPKGLGAPPRGTTRRAAPGEREGLPVPVGMAGKKPAPAPAAEGEAPPAPKLPKAPPGVRREPMPATGGPR
jgi:hypothetical protein